MRLSTIQHACIIDVQVSMPFPPPCLPAPWSSPLWWLLVELQILLPQMPYPLYSLHMITILLCYSVLLMLWKPVRGEVCRAAPPADVGSVGAKHSYLYSGMGIYRVFKPPSYCSPFGFKSTPLKSSSIEVLRRADLTGFNSEVPRPILLILQRLRLVPLKGT